MRRDQRLGAASDGLEPSEASEAVDETMAALIRRAASVHSEREAIVNGASRLSYSDVERASAELATGLIARGCGKGSRVGILFPNGPEWVIAFVAVLRIGAIAVPINTFSRARELVWLLRHSDVQILLMCDAYLNHDYLTRLEEGIEGLSASRQKTLMFEAVPLLRHVFVWGEASRSWTRSGSADLAGIAADAPRPPESMLAAIESEVAPSDPALVIYTSGSTADPKGVIHSQGTLVRQSGSVAAMRDLVPGDRLYINMPFFWVGGLLLGPLCCLQTGACVHCDAPIGEEELLELLVKERITRLSSAFPSTLALKAHPGYDPVAHGHVREFVEGGFTRVFGMTESFGWHSAEAPGGAGATGGEVSFGRAVPGIERRIVDPETGRALGPNESGELALSGQNLMLGYHKRSREDVFEADGSFRTGDGCRLDAAGALFFEARLDEMIRSRGTNVAPAEIEAVLHSLSQVKRAAVVGLPDAQRGERVVAVVVPATGAAFSVDAVEERLKANLAAYKVPAEIVVLEESELPLGATQKVMKSQLKEFLLARTR